MATDTSGWPGILRLLVDLADPANGLLERFRQSEEQAREIMRDYGLTDGEQATVLSGSLTKIRAAIDSAFVEAGLQPPGDDAYLIVVSWAPPRPPKARSIGVW